MLVVNLTHKPKNLVATKKLHRQTKRTVAKIKVRITNRNVTFEWETADIHLVIDIQVVLALFLLQLNSYTIYYLLLINISFFIQPHTFLRVMTPVGNRPK